MIIILMLSSHELFTSPLWVLFFLPCIPVVLPTTTNHFERGKNKIIIHVLKTIIIIIINSKSCALGRKSFIQCR